MLDIYISMAIIAVIVALLMEWNDLVVGSSCRLIEETEADEWNTLVICHKQFDQHQMDGGEKWQLITTVRAKLNDDDDWDDDFEIPYWALNKAGGLYAHLGSMKIKSKATSVTVEFMRTVFAKGDSVNNKVIWR